MTVRFIPTASVTGKALRGSSLSEAVKRPRRKVRGICFKATDRFCAALPSGFVHALQQLFPRRGFCGAPLVRRPHQQGLRLGPGVVRPHGADLAHYPLIVTGRSQ